MKVITTKVNKAIGLLQKLQKTLLRLVLITVYEALVRPHLDYGNMIYDKAYIERFHQKLESIQYNTCPTLSGAIRGSSREKLWHELGLESLKNWRNWIIIPEIQIKILYFILHITFSNIVFSIHCY